MNLKKIYNIMKFAGFMLAGSLVFYAGIIEFILWNGAADEIVEDSGRAAMWRNVFIAVSISAYAVISYLKKRMLKTVYKNPAAMLSGLYMNSIAILILCQAPAILGIAQFFIGEGSRMEFYPFMIISGLFFIIFFPRYSDWDDVAKNNKGQPE
ncbi:MAG: hypothetical protein ACLFP1_07155 [Candidatus Goldiibacteriota bacterium]